MFKKTKIAAATVALLSVGAMQTASAIYISGTGATAASGGVMPTVLNPSASVSLDESGAKAQVLVFPYYNTNNSFATGFTIRNTTGETKAVKVRFRDSKLSNDVLDFNLYMSPWDRFTMSVVAVPDQTPGAPAGQKVAKLITTDKSCTDPAIPADGVIFNPFTYTKTLAADTLEGYLEVIEMGVVNPSAVVAGSTRNIVAGITHTAAGVPADCSVIGAAWTSGTFTEGGANAYTDTSVAPGNGVVTPGVINDVTKRPGGIGKPTGGLQGWSFLLDFVKGNAFVAMPTQIRNYQTLHGQHYRANNPFTGLLPSLASGNVTSSTVMSGDGTGANRNNWAVLGSTQDYASTAAGQSELTPHVAAFTGVNPYPISDVLAAVGVTNDYLIDPAFSQATDWIITLPMRKHGIYPNVTYASPATATTPTNADVLISPNQGGFYNSEERPSFINAFSPAAIQMLPREVNVLTFVNYPAPPPVASSVLGTIYRNVVSVDTGFLQGWGRLNFFTSTAGNRMHDSRCASSATALPSPATSGAATISGAPATAVGLDGANTATSNSDSGLTGAGLAVADCFAATYPDGRAFFKGVPAIGFAALQGRPNTSGAGSYIGESVPHVFRQIRP
jgi:hypothetical protein